MFFQRVFQLRGNKSEKLLDIVLRVNNKKEYTTALMLFQFTTS